MSGSFDPVGDIVRTHRRRTLQLPRGGNVRAWPDHAIHDRSEAEPGRRVTRTNVSSAGAGPRPGQDITTQVSASQPKSHSRQVPASIAIDSGPTLRPPPPPRRRGRFVHSIQCRGLSHRDVWVSRSAGRRVARPPPRGHWAFRSSKVRPRRIVPTPNVSSVPVAAGRADIGV
jgi:hypothetical protein